MPVLVNESRALTEESAGPLQRSPSVVGRFGHPAAYLFARELEVQSVRGQVVASCRCPAEGRVELLREWTVLF